ncbi:MAG: aminotransferase class I/II-fold pyridoxal phosphate-dependent enzyme [Vampirovibrionales bacterium]|nr:aminotransferase class I/II-fold pyridoxal phosphate-dependent enzyme [Vampirovibrionales bacterium]
MSDAPSGHHAPSVAFETRVLEEAPNEFGAVVAPVYRSSTYRIADVRQPLNQQDGYVYARFGNPNVRLLEEKLAALEGGRHGLCFASGMGAISTFCLAILRAGDHLLCDRIVYAGTRHFLTMVLAADFGVEVEFVDFRDPQALQAALRPQTRLVYCESPTNPTMDVLDLAALAAIAKEGGAPLVVDNTFASPYLQNPLALGAEAVLHSLTKYIGGHSNEIGGAIILKDDGPTRQEPSWIQRLRLYQTMIGATLSPDAAWQLNQGIKTLPLRMRAHCENAMALARFLQGHPQVRDVFYPGLPSHPAHEIVKRQMPRGFGGMLAFETRGGLSQARAFLAEIGPPYTTAVSLGGVESLICGGQALYPTLDEDALTAMGVAPGLIRVSAGVEAIDDLTREMDRALNAVAP